MDPLRRRVLLAIGGTAALAGCIGDDDDGDPVADDGDDDMATDDDDDMADADDDDDAAPDATVQVSDHPDYGDILVGPDRLTLYMFDADEQGADESACYDDCAENWPPLIEEDPGVGDGVTAELTTFERDDEEVQVAANGWPLYYWVTDEEEGDVDGQGVNDVWWVLTPDGEPIRDEDEDDEDMDDDTDDMDADDDDGYADDYEEDDSEDDDEDDGANGGGGGGY